VRTKADSQMLVSGVALAAATDPKRTLDFPRYVSAKMVPDST